MDVFIVTYTNVSVGPRKQTAMLQVAAGRIATFYLGHECLFLYVINMINPCSIYSSAQY